MDEFQSDDEEEGIVTIQLPNGLKPMRLVYAPFFDEPLTVPLSKIPQALENPSAVWIMRSPEGPYVLHI